MYCVLCITEELNLSQTETKQVKEENSALKTELAQAQTQVHDKSEMVIDLQGKLIVKYYHKINTDIFYRLAECHL